MALFSFPSGALATTASILVTGAYSGTNYYTNDTFVLAVSGAANSPVTVSVNGGPFASAGTTGPANGEPGGQLVLSGTWTPANIGSYTEVWAVAGVKAAPLSFAILQTPTPTAKLTVSGQQSGSTYYVFDTFTLTVTGAPNGAITVSEDGGTPVSDGIMPSTGTLTVNGQWMAASIDKYSEVWSVNDASAQPLSFTVDGPVKMKAVDDGSGPCYDLAGQAPSCTDIGRYVGYQVINFSGSAIQSAPVCENLQDTSWTCEQSEPSVSSNVCNKNNGEITDGVLGDVWSLIGTLGVTFTPYSCGYANRSDMWEYPLANSGVSNSATVVPFGYLTGDELTTEITIWGCSTSNGCALTGTMIGPSGVIH